MALPPDRCPRCAFKAPCLCGSLPRIVTRLRIDIVRHAAEQWKTTSSARWAALALPGARVFDYGAVDRPFDESSLGETDGAWLLFPGPHPTPLPARPPRRLIVPDGTWQQARRMVSRLASLRELPRLTLLPDPRPRLRKPFRADGRSTIEAIAAALQAFGEPGPAATLRGVHEAAVGLIEERRGYPIG